MEKIALKEILSIALDVGEHMLKCGAEVSRVERSISIICSGYGVKYMEVFAMNSLIVATLRDDIDSVTESRRIQYYETDLDQLEKLNALSRQICKNNISRDLVLEKIDECRGKKHGKKILLGQIIVSASFTFLFGGNIRDAIVASFIAIILYCLNTFIKDYKLNNLINSFTNSAIIGFIAIILTKIGIGNHVDKIIIGDIMLLIPGLAMFTSVNDICKGDTLSGLGRLIEGIFLALAIAAGVGFSLLMLGGIL
jgi:uncharacterized membrane protein YjjP (DUF1212 family)